jgi:hypothetical protein
MMRAQFIFVLPAACALLAAAVPAAGCGVCVEDKVAVTYDHAVVVKAVESKHVVVFAAIEGAGNPQVAAREVKAAATRVPGVDRNSVRSAASPAAVSFALDPNVASAESTVAAIEKAARAPGVRLSILRVVR